MTTPAPSEALGPEPERDETLTGDLYGKPRWYVCAAYADWHRERADLLRAQLERAREWMAHPMGCRAYVLRPCTCGLTDFLKSLEGT